MENNPLLGVHISIAGGIEQSLREQKRVTGKFLKI